MISGEDRPEHVPEAQGVCGQPHWPGGKLNNNYDDFSAFYDDYYTMISFVSTVGEENLRRDNGKVC